MDTGRAGREVAFAGQHVQHKAMLAITLSTVIPVLVLTWALHVQILPRLDVSRHGLLAMWVQLLMVCVGMVAAAGAWVVWDVAAAVARTAKAVTGGQPVEPLAAHGGTTSLAARGDEVGSILQSFSRMIATIEAQATEITASATQLDTAYRDLESANAELKELSFTDPVTGLYNRRFFAVRLDEELSRYRRAGRPVSVAMLDLDGFKGVNDAMGHAAGDETLRTVARLLLDSSRGMNVISRFGGDEFAVVLAETAKAGAIAYAQRVCALIAAHPFEPGTGVTVSVGVATLPDEGIDGPEALVAAADAALYAAKRAGKNRAMAHTPLAAITAPPVPAPLRATA